MNLMVFSRVLFRPNIFHSAHRTALESLKPTLLPHRNIWAWLNPVWNRVDKDRIKLVGPDRAAAEWLLRCGAFIKWKNFEKWQTDYNTLPATNERYKIEEIDATDSCIMYIGFPYLNGLSQLRRVVLRKCSYLDDRALENLAFVKDTLEHLEISSCGNITDSGIIALRGLGNLKSLTLFDLPEVKDRYKCVAILEVSLPGCEITFKDEKEVEQEKKELKMEGGKSKGINDSKVPEKKEQGNKPKKPKKPGEKKKQDNME